MGQASAIISLARVITACGAILLSMGLHGAIASADVVSKVPGWPKLEQRSVIDKLGRHIRYYISNNTAPRPLALFIQGSGCSLLFAPGPNGIMYSRSYVTGIADQYDRFTILEVEKPFAGGKNDGTADSCSAEFNEDFTADRWFEALRAAFDDARKLHRVDRSRALIFGESEGADMAAMMAGRHSAVTDVVMIGGGGPSQLFELFAFGYVGGGWLDVTKGDFSEIESDVKAINSDPNSSTKMIWGHPYKRWSSFFALSPLAEILKSHARVYLAAGTNDQSTPIISMEVTAATLLGKGRDVTFRRVQGADHSLMTEPGNFKELESEYQRAFSWFWKEK